MDRQIALPTFTALISLTLVIGCATSKPIHKPSDHDAPMENVFVIEHSFEADVKTVFDMWVNPDSFSSWLGPDGATMSFIRVGIKEGGTSQWSMTTADGVTKYGKLNYKIINPQHLLVYTQNFCDKDGKLSKPPGAATYPDMLLTTVTFNEEGKKKTRVVVKWEIFGQATEAERQTFDKLKPVMTNGWGQSFDKLDSLLKLKNKPQDPKN